MTIETLARCSAVIERKALSAALKLLSGVVSSRSTVPFLSAVRMICHPGRVTLIGTGLDIILRHDVPAETTPGSLLLELATLKSTVAKMKGTTVRLVDNGAGVTLSDPAAGAAFRLPLVEGESEFPIAFAACKDWTEAFELDAAQFRSDLARVACSISLDETRYYLNGVCMHHSEATDSLRFATTDGHRLTRIVRDMPAGLDLSDKKTKHPLKGNGVILPRLSVKLLVDAIGAKGAAGTRCSVRLSPTQADIEFGAVSISTKLIDGTFPDYCRVIPTGNSSSITVAADVMAGIADSVTAHCEQGRKAVRALALCADGQTLAASAFSADRGYAGAMVPGVELELPKGQREIGFNARYMADAMGLYGAERVCIRIEDASAPALISCDAVPEMISVLMPTRVGGTILDRAGVAKLNGEEPAQTLAQVETVEPAPVEAPAPVIAPSEPEMAPIEAAAPVELEEPAPSLAQSIADAIGVTLNPEPATAPVEAIEPAAVEPVDAPAATVETLEPVPAALEAADATAREALAEMGPMPSDPVSEEGAAWWQACEAAWFAYVGQAYACGPDGWQVAVARQRDRKARNRGKAVISGHAFNVLRDRFHALAPAAPIEDAPAPISDAISDAPAVDALASTVAQLLSRVAQLEQGKAPRTRTPAHLRAIRAYIRLRAERARMRQDVATATAATFAATAARVQAANDRAAAVQADADRMAGELDEARQTVDRLELALTSERNAAVPLRAEIARLAPIANAMAAMAQAAAPSLATVEA